MFRPVAALWITQRHGRAGGVEWLGPVVPMLQGRFGAATLRPFVDVEDRNAHEEPGA